MNCPSCGKRTRVMNSRHTDSNSGDNRNLRLMGWADSMVGWYTADWVARERQCDCGWKKRSLEILENDLNEMIKLWKDGDKPHGGDNEQGK